MPAPHNRSIHLLQQLPETRQLHAFHAAASARSLRECAVGLGISQPAVSRSIQLLEHNLSAPLLERSRQGVRLTPEGAQLHECTQRLFALMQQATQEVSTLRRRAAGQVRLGIPATLSGVLLPPLLNLYRHEIGTTQLSILEGSARHIAQWLKSGEVDIGIIVGPSSDKRLSVELLYDEELYLMGRTIPAAASNGVISFADLAPLPLALPLLPLGSRAILESLAADAGVALQPVVEVDSPGIQKLLVLNHGLYSVFSPLVCRDELRDGTIQATRISPAPRRAFYIATLDGQGITPATRLVAHLLRRVGQKSFEL